MREAEEYEALRDSQKNARTGQEAKMDRGTSQDARRATWTMGFIISVVLCVVGIIVAALKDETIAKVRTVDFGK